MMGIPPGTRIVLAGPFLCLLVAALIFYCVCELRPWLLRSFVSVPEVFRLAWSRGTRAMDLKTCLYLVFHRNTVDDVFHHDALADQIAWFVLAGAAGGVPALVALCIVLTLQAASFGERRLTAVLAATWLTISLLALFAVRSLGAGPAANLSILLLIAGTALRVIGHAFEPLPPGVGHAGARFAPIRFSPAVPFIGVLGFVAEFIAGMPFYGLLASQVWLMLLRLGHHPRHLASLTGLSARTANMVRDGWAGDETTRALCELASR